MVVFPADVLHPRRVGDHFAAEADAARAAGLTVGLVDHDGLSRPDGADAAVARVGGTGAAVYRGWMLTADRYRDFFEALTRRGVRLRTTPQMYRRAHELPGWYPALAAHTPPSTWTVGAGRGDFDHARRELSGGPAVVRDYVKSAKHYWDEAMFIPDLNDGDQAWAVASRLRELRDDEFVGGFVLRRFEPFVSTEIRTWWWNGTCRLIGPHLDTAQAPAPDGLDLSTVAAEVTGLGLSFVTVDLARRDDGQWRVVELGDGQVSDRPAAITPDSLVDLFATEQLSLSGYSA
jgi:hypothetical protein